MILNLRKFNDPRIFVLSLLFTYAATLISNPAFGKSLFQLALAFSSAAITDLLICKFILKKPFRFPLSSLTSVIGIVLILFSPHDWVFVAVPVIAMCSKYFIKYKNIHFFNPNNFGIVFALTFLGSYVSTTGGRWAGPPMLFFAVIILGFLISLRAQRIELSLAWIASFVFFAVIRSKVQGLTMEQVLVPMAGPLFYLYSFYHITDPVTSPRNTTGKIIFGVSLGFVDNLFRYNEILYSPFYSLFLLTAVQPLLEGIFKRDFLREQWRLVPFLAGARKY